MNSSDQDFCGMYLEQIKQGDLFFSPSRSMARPSCSVRILKPCFSIRHLASSIGIPMVTWRIISAFMTLRSSDNPICFSLGAELPGVIQAGRNRRRPVRKVARTTASLKRNKCILKHYRWGDNRDAGEDQGLNLDQDETRSFRCRA